MTTEIKLTDEQKAALGFLIDLLAHEKTWEKLRDLCDLCEATWPSVTGGLGLVDDLADVAGGRP